MYVREWAAYLQHSDALIGLPLGVAGVMLLFGGWRIWKGAVVLSFGLLGALVGIAIGGDRQQEMLYGAIGFLVAGGLSMPPVFYAVGVLGGIIGAGMVNYFAAQAGLVGAVLWIATAIGAITAGALSFINLRQVIIVITSFEGAVLVLSAIVALLSLERGLHGFFNQMAFESAIFIPFVMLVPTVCGVLLQSADAKQKDFSLAPR